MKNLLVKGMFLLSVFSVAALPVFADYTASNMATTSAQPAKSVLWDLQHLTELLKDGQEGYKLSSENVKNLALKNLFSQYAEQRARFLNDLRAEVARLGGDPDEGGTALGKAHRGWINVRTAITKKDDQAIVNEVLNGEKVALKDYQEVAQKDLPSETRRLVLDQMNGIQNAYNQVQAIEITQEKMS